MHYALFISFFQKMEGMIPSFIPKRTVSVQEVLPSPQGFGLQMIQLGSKLGLFLAWGRELGSADSAQSQFIQVPLLAKQQIALLWALG